MKIEWHVTAEDVQRIKEFVASRSDDPFVLRRRERNLEAVPPIVGKDLFWQVMISALLTTQQRSGPTSAIKRFLDRKPFPLSLDACMSQADLAAFVEHTLARAGGIRRSTTIGKQAQTNLNTLDPRWDEFLAICNGLRSRESPQQDRRAAHFLAESIQGFGPKQSRNFLQWLGLTKYEIPLDSRLTKWFNNFGFPIRLSANALSDPHYYDFVSDGVHALCSRAEIYPCILDAAIFSSFDGGAWTDETLGLEESPGV